jgi:erythromycin esterase-like protein
MAAVLDLDNITEVIQEISHPLHGPLDLDVLMDRIGNAHYVLLGEASHGTSEYYAWRSVISRRLITEKGFNFIAVEGDWPDCYRLNRYVKHYPRSGSSAEAVLRGYKRWPTWMWANREIIALAEWLRLHNEGLDNDSKVGFYGLDVYSLWDSIKAVVNYLEKVDPPAAEQARQAYRCFEPFNGDSTSYAYHTAFTPKSCEDDAIKMLRHLLEKLPTYKDDHEETFNAEQNARVVVNAERYYRTMLKGDAASWNIRDNHMAETLASLMKRYGPEAKGIVWAHNTHVGDARYTDMAGNGMVNIGQLVREQSAEDDTVLVGFGSYMGTVVAGSYWDAPPQIMEVPPAPEDSWEGLMHQADRQDKLILSDVAEGAEHFWQIRGHRAIGVVYNPERDFGQYVPTLLPRRYDAFLYLDKTRALHPLRIEAAHDRELPETFPWAV